MRVLEPGAESQADDTHVTWADQKQIIEFSRIMEREDEVAELLTKIANEIEEMEEVETELELADEDEPALYKVDASFLHLPPSKALERMQASLAKLREQQDELKSELDDCAEQQKTLKASLYAKFGKSINLEKGDD